MKCNRISSRKLSYNLATDLANVAIHYRIKGFVAFPVQSNKLVGVVNMLVKLFNGFGVGHGSNNAKCTTVLVY